MEQAAAVQPPKRRPLGQKIDRVLFFVLFFAIWLVFNLLWSSSYSITHFEGSTVIHTTQYGMPIIVTITTTQSEDQPPTARRKWHPGNAALVLAGVGLFALGATYAANRLRPTKAIGRPFVLLLLVAALVGTGLACFISQLMWGFAWRPAELDARVVEAKEFHGMSEWTTDGKQGLAWRPLKPNPHYSSPTEGGLEYTLYELTQAGVPLRTFGSIALSGGQVAELIRAPEVRVRNEKGYDYTKYMRGVWIDFTGADGERYLFLAVNGAEVSNDTRPHFRLLYRYDGQRIGERVGHQQFYYDVAGLEAFTPQSMATGLGFFGMLLSTFTVFAIFAFRRG